MATVYAEEVSAALPHARPAALSAMRRCASTPTLHSLGGAPDGDGIEVFVVLRNFQEAGGGLFARLPAPLRDGVRDAGVCHYMTVFRQPDGTLVQFDFGPAAGGDIHVPRGPLARLLSAAPRGGGRAVPGAVREHRLTALPPAHMYVGRTPLSLADIRAWNGVHASPAYELHRADCRHYVNSLVRYATGVEAATAAALAAQWAANRHRYGIADRVVRLGHYVTDAANWGRVRAVGAATAAALATLTGQQALAKLKAAPLVGAVQRRLLPAARRALVPGPRALSLSQRPAVAVGATAVGAYAAAGGQTPGAVRDTLTLGARVTGGVAAVARAAASLAEHVGRSASAATQHTTGHAVALATGIASAASRGAVSMMVVARPRRAAAQAGPLTASPPRAVAAPGAIAVSAEPRGSPLRAMLPAFKGRRAQALALVASRR